MNKLCITGNLTRDPELRVTVDGTPVCSFTVAENRKVNGKELTTFFKVSAWRGLADLCNRYLAKGKKVLVTGPVTMSTYFDSKGVPRSSLDVRADEVEFLFAKTIEPAADEGFEDLTDDDIPFKE